MACGCEKTYNIGMGCCVPVLGPVENYYTKYQVDRLIEGVIESGCCITPEQVDEKIESAKTEIESEIPSLDGYATKEYLSGYTYDKATIDSKVASGGTFDPAYYYTKNEVNSLINGIRSEITQNVINLQEQINSLISAISGCCGETGETFYRWITMNGENDYWCSGTTKMSKEKEQSSADGINWTDTGNIRNGSTILEVNCLECGYVPPSVGTKFNANYSNGDSYGTDCDGNATLTSATTKPNGYDYTIMTSAVIGDCITHLHYGVFEDCTSLTSVTIPNSVISIENAAFYGCESLPRIDLPSGLTSIDHYVFQDCYSLSSVTIPSGVTSIGAGAFVACSGLTEIRIPDAVTEIRGGAFNNCTSLSSVTIGTGITEIFNEAFKGCTSLTSVIIEATVPPTLGSGSDSFDDTNNCPIYVPSESVNDYKTSIYKGWNLYADRIQAIP